MWGWDGSRKFPESLSTQFSRKKEVPRAEDEATYLSAPLFRSAASALGTPGPPHAPRLHRSSAPPAAPAASPSGIRRRPRSSTPRLAVGSSAATLSSPASPLPGGAPQPPSSPRPPPGQVRKFGVRVALLAASRSA